jgi:hypothetical protein
VKAELMAESMAACRELLRDGLPGTVPDGSDGEFRFIPLAVDINGDAAVTVFVRQMTGGEFPGSARPGDCGISAA